MQKYRKKPVVIEAEQWKEGDPWIEPMETCGCGDNDACGNCGKPIIQTEEGPLAVSPGDYIIKGIEGEFYPCKPDIFKQTYEKVEDV